MRCALPVLAALPLTALSLAALPLAATAGATDADRTRAEGYVELGHTLFDQGEYAAALEEYRHALPFADELGQADAVRWNIARCHEELGQWAEATVAFEAFAAGAADAERAAAGQAKADALAARAFAAVTVECAAGHDMLIRLDGGDARGCPAAWDRVPAGPITLEITVSGVPGEVVRREVAAGSTHRIEPTPAGRLVVSGGGIDVMIDGVPLGVLPPAGLSLPSGPHTVRLAGRGRPPETHSVVVPPGGAVEIHPQAPSPPAPADPPPDSEPPLVTEAPVDPWPWVAAGAGVAAAITGGALLAAAAASDDEAHAAYDRWRALPDSASDAERRALQDDTIAADDRAVALRTGGWIALGAAAAAGGLAAWLWLDGPPDADARVQIGAAPDGALFTVKGAW